MILPPLLRRNTSMQLRRLRARKRGVRLTSQPGRYYERASWFLTQTRTCSSLRCITSLAMVGRLECCSASWQSFMKPSSPASLHPYRHCPSSTRISLFGNEKPYREQHCRDSLTTGKRNFRAHPLFSSFLPLERVPRFKDSMVRKKYGCYPQA